jgi:hypothetical protein
MIDGGFWMASVQFDLDNQRRKGLLLAFVLERECHV